MHVVEVDVGESDDATVGEVAGRGDLLGDGADQILRGDHRHIIAAGDGDVDLPGDHAAVLVVERDGEELGFGSGRREVQVGVVGHRVGKGEVAAGAAAGGIG